MIRLITFILLTVSSAVFAQNFSGKATYQTKRIFKEIKVKEDSKNPELTKQLNEAMKKASEKTFFLEFTQEESLYTQEEKLEQPTTGNVSVSFSSSTSGKFYKNLKENYSILENDYLGKTFLIKDTLHTSDWELSPESKKIGNYTVYKATRPYKQKNYLSEDEDDKTKKSEEKEEKTSDLLSMIDKEEPKELFYTAWYTPEIPIPNGPEMFTGLPGLILELHTPNEIYLCSEIVLNPKKAIKIKAPKGKITSQKEYDDMIKENFKKMEKTKDSKGNTIYMQTIEIGG